MKTLLIASICLLISPIALLSQTTPNQTEFNIWNDISLTIPLVKEDDKNGKSVDKISANVYTTLRFGRDNLRFVDERIGVGIKYRINKYISLAPDVFYRGTQPFAGNKSYETRVRFAVNVQNKWSKFSLVDRNQIEYRFRNSKKNDVRYKNRLRLNVPIKREKKEVVTFFTSDEPYYNLTTNKVTRNELLIGLAKKFNKNFSSDFYYVWAQDRGFPKIVHGVGISLKFRIDK